jgi:WD40 repeat protein
MPEVFAFSPDSSLIVRTGELDRRIHLLKSDTGAVQRTIDFLPGAPRDDFEDATGIAFSPDGQTLAATGYIIGPGSPLVRAIRFSDGMPLPAFKHLSPEGGAGVAFSPGGDRLAAHTDAGGALSMFRTSDRALLWTSDLRLFRFANTPRMAPAFSPDGSLVATVNPESGTRVFSSSDGALVVELMSEGTGGATFSPAGDLLAVATESGLRIHRTSDWALLREVPGAFASVAFSPDGTTLLAGGEDGNVRLFCDSPASNPR